MANIVGTQTVDGIYVINVDADPTTGGGTPAPMGSIALANDGSGTFYKTGSLDTNWSANPSTTLFGVTRYVYLVRDASDATKLGGTTNNVYTTFQTAYDFANTLQILLGGASTVVIMVGNTTAGSVGSLVLTANYNNSVEIVGISQSASIIGTITSTTFTVNINLDNVTLGTITTTGANVTLRVRNAVTGNIVTTSTTGVSGNFIVANSYNSTIGTITANAILGNCGTISVSNSKSLNIGNITTNQTSTTASFSIGIFNILSCDNCRFGAYTATMAFATSTGSVGGLNINNTNQNILFSGVITIQGFTNITLATSDVVVSNFIANNTTFNGNVHVNSRDILSTASETGGTISNVIVKNCIFNGARVRFFYNATTNTNITAIYTFANCKFNNATSSGGVYCKVYNTTFDNIKIENCYVVGISIGISIENPASPVDLLTGNPLIINGVNGIGIVVVNVVQSDLGFDEVQINDVNVSTLQTFIIDGDATFNIRNCGSNLLSISSTSGSLVKRSKYTNCDGNIDSDGIVLLTISTSDLVFVTLTSNFNIDVYSSTVNFYAIGAVTIAGTLYTSNVIRKNTSTLTTTMNNSFDISLP